jgi:hypothetical protein
MKILANYLKLKAEID